MLTHGEDVEAHALRQRGWTISAMAHPINRDRKTVRVYLNGTRVPGVRARSRPDPLEPFVDYLVARFADDPHVWSSALHDEVRSLGYVQSYPCFARKVRLAGLRPHCEACHGVKGRDTTEIGHHSGLHIGDSVGLVSNDGTPLGRHRLRAAGNPAALGTCPGRALRKPRPGASRLCSQVIHAGSRQGLAAQSILSVCYRSMSVPVTLLGLLEREPSHGYDLKRDYDAFFGRNKPLPFGQVYATLARLTRDGKVTPGATEPGEGPDRKRYAVTASGEREFESWISKPIEPEPHLQTVLFTKVVLALMLGRSAESYLDIQRAAHLRRMRELTAMKQTDDLIGALLADHGLFHLEADLRWIDMTAARLPALAETLQ
jgi:DNA-binding PadR family transcriptional regulator